MSAAEYIVGAERLIDLFGGWPSFHDAEIVRLTLDRRDHDEPDAQLFIHLWETLPDLDERGFFKREKHTLVEIVLRRFTACELKDFNLQNVLFDFDVEAGEIDGQPAIRVTLDSSYGLSGTFTCDEVEIVSLVPCDIHGQPIEGRRESDRQA